MVRSTYYMDYTACLFDIIANNVYICERIGQWHRNLNVALLLEFCPDHLLQ